MPYWGSMATRTRDLLAEARALAPPLKALADPHRLALVLLLADEPRSVKQLQDATGLQQTLVSHHLRALRDHGIVRSSPQGRSNVYELCCDALVEPVRAIARLAADG
jgi:DNA-binding transcriptional ArsR family regulator